MELVSLLLVCVCLPINEGGGEGEKANIYLAVVNTTVVRATVSMKPISLVRDVFLRPRGVCG